MPFTLKEKKWPLENHFPTTFLFLLHQIVLGAAEQAQCVEQMKWPVSIQDEAGEQPGNPST